MSADRGVCAPNLLTHLHSPTSLGSASPVLFTLIPFRFRREPRLIRLARISFRFRQCLMAKYRHYLVGGTPCLSEPPASGLAKAMRLTIERETGASNRIADPLTETVNRKRPTIFSVDDGRMVALSGGQNRDQVAVERNRELARHCPPDQLKRRVRFTG